MNWNVLCPGCGGVLDTGASAEDASTSDGLRLRAVLARLRADARRDGRGGVHRQSARAPDRGARSRTRCRCGNISGRYSGAPASICPSRISIEQMEEFTIDAMEIGARREGADVAAVAGRFRHPVRAGDAFAHFIDVKGEPTKERQALSADLQQGPFADRHASKMRPGPLRIALENKSDVRALPARLDRRRTSARSARQAAAVPDREAAADQPDLPRHLSHRHARRRPAAEDHEPHLPVHRPQGLDRALRAGRRHRRPTIWCASISACCSEIVAAEAGAVVKTIGDAVMATFPTPDRALAAAFRMRESMQDHHADGDLLLKIGIHEGPCLAVTLERPAGLFRPDRQHRGARAGPRRRQARSSPPSRWWRTRRSRRCWRAGKPPPTEQLAALRGVADKMAVFPRSLSPSVDGSLRQCVVCQSPDRFERRRSRDRSCARPNACRPASRRSAGRPPCRTEC